MDDHDRHDHDHEPEDGPGTFIKIDSLVFMRTVYVWLFIAVGTAVAAAVVTHMLDVLPGDPERTELLAWVETIRTGAIFIGMTAAKMGRARLVTFFLVLCSVMSGISFGSLLTFATPESVAAVFVAAVALFGTFSLFGYTTARDLTPLSLLYTFSFVFFLGFRYLFPIPFPEVLTVAVVVGLACSLLIVAYETQRTKVFAHAIFLDVEQAAAVALFQSFTLFLGFTFAFAGVFFMLFEPRPPVPNAVAPRDC